MRDVGVRRRVGVRHVGVRRRVGVRHVGVRRRVGVRHVGVRRRVGVRHVGVRRGHVRVRVVGVRRVRVRHVGVRRRVRVRHVGVRRRVRQSVCGASVCGASAWSLWSACAGRRIQVDVEVINDVVPMRASPWISLWGVGLCAEADGMLMAVTAGTTQPARSSARRVKSFCLSDAVNASALPRA